MSVELIYTSIAKGLKPGSSGFCTAGATAGMSKQVATKLEMLSGYEFRFGISDPKADLNPVNLAHTRLQLSGQTRSVLSRVGFAGADYSGRANKIAHHFMLAPDEQLAGGPAWMQEQMLAQQIYRTEWTGAAQELSASKLDGLAQSSDPPRPAPATQWESATGDAGWAGVLLEAYRKNPKTPAYVIFPPGLDVFALFAECLALLPAAERWQLCYCSYYTATPAGCYYHWRGVTAGSKAIKEAQRFSQATVIDLTKKLAVPPDNLYTQAARTGTVLGPVDPAAPDRHTDSPAPDAAKDKGVMVSLTPSDTQHLQQPPVTIEKNSRAMKVLAAGLSVLVVVLLATIALMSQRLKDARTQLAISQAAVVSDDKQAYAVAENQPAEADVEAGPVSEQVTPPAMPPPTTEVPQVATPPILPQFHAKLYSREELVSRKYKFVSVNPINAEELSFAARGAVAFVGPPIVLAKDMRYKRQDKITYDVAKGRLTLKCARISGTGRQTLVVCTIKGSDDKRTLSCQIESSILDKPVYMNKLKYMVVELANDEKKRVYRYRLSPKPRISKARILRLGFSGPDAWQEPNELSIAYPWPETLSLVNGQGQSIPFAPPYEFSWEDPNNAAEMQCRIEFEVAEDNLRCSVGITTDAARTQLAAAAQARRGNKETEYTRKLIELTQNAFKKNGYIRVVDVWGLTVAQIRLEFSAPAKPKPTDK